MAVSAPAILSRTECRLRPSLPPGPPSGPEVRDCFRVLHAGLLQEVLAATFHIVCAADRWSSARRTCRHSTVLLCKTSEAIGGSGQHADVPSF